MQEEFKNISTRDLILLIDELTERFNRELSDYNRTMLGALKNLTYEVGQRHACASMTKTQLETQAYLLTCCNNPTVKS